ncbi:hypothetical protein PENSPDRAFT_151094 [Peniophora sp. CONT]|nr:hypothetical protein PENSPDRAFT_151094 [Peniophora sp. CONT]
MAQTTALLQRQAVRVNPLEFHAKYKGRNQVAVMKALLDKFRLLYQRSSERDDQGLLVCADSVNCALIIHEAAVYDTALDWGLHEFYQDIIMEDDFFTTPVFFADSIIEGLTSLLIYFGHQIAQKIRSHPAKAVVISRASLLWKRIWDQRHLLKLHPKSEHQYVGKNWVPGTSWSEPIVQMAFAYHELLQIEMDNIQYNEILIDTYIQHVGLYCLLSFNQPGIDPDYRDFAYRITSSLVLAESQVYAERLVSEVLLIDGGRAADSFAIYLSELLQRDEPFTALEFEEFQKHKQALVVLACHPGLLPHLWKMGVHEHCVRALAHVFWNTDPDNFMGDWYVCHVMTDVALDAMEMSVDLENAPAIYCRGEDVVTESVRTIDCLLSHPGGSIRLATHQYAGAQQSLLQDHILSRLQTIVRVVAVLQTRYDFDQAAQAFLQSMKKAMHEEWWASRTYMEACKPSIREWAIQYSDLVRIETHAAITTAWDTIAHALGLSDEEESQRFHKSVPNRCTRLLCRYSRQELPEGKPRKCAGCGAVYYCSRQCQTSVGTGSRAGTNSDAVTRSRPETVHSSIQIP